MHLQSLRLSTLSARPSCAVECNQVSRRPRVALHRRVRARSKVLDPRRDSIHIRDILQRHHIRHQARHVGTRHASPAQCRRRGRAPDPCALHPHARCKDVHGCPEIAKGCARVRGLINRTDGDGAWGGGWRVVACVDVLVARCHDWDAACGADRVDG